MSNEFAHPLTSEQLATEAQARLAHLLPDAPIDALSQYQHTKRKLYRLRLVTASVTDDVCSMASTPEEVLTRFVRAVAKYVAEQKRRT